MQEPEIKLNGWVTIKTLSEKVNLPTKHLSVLVARNKIPSRLYPELNDLKLVPEDWTQDKQATK